MAVIEHPGSRSPPTRCSTGAAGAQAAAAVADEGGHAPHNVDLTRFDMRLRYKDQLDDALYNTDLPPQIVLSEGQLAANGFSILCAASTAYPWSRWRALLLDRISLTGVASPAIWILNC